MPQIQLSEDDLNIMFALDPQVNEEEQSQEQAAALQEGAEEATSTACNKKTRTLACQQILKADKNKNDFRAPRKRCELLEMKGKGDILKCKMHFETRAEAKMAIKENNEVCRCSTKFVKSDSERMELVGRREGCTFYAYISPSSKTGTLVLREFRDHSLGCAELQHAKGESNTAYSFRDLALIEELQEAIKANYLLPFTDISRILADFVHEKLCDSKLSRLRGVLRRNLLGTARDAVRTIPAHLAALEEDGHSTRHVVQKAEVVKKMYLAQMQSQHEHQQQQVPRNNRKPWAGQEELAKEEIDAMFEGDSSDTLYLVSFSIFFRSAIKMIPSLIPVGFTDGTHMRNVAGGVLYSTVMLDANHHIIVVCITWHIGSECMAGWKAHLTHVMLYAPTSLRFIIDGTRTGIPVCRELGMRFIVCSQHTAKNISDKVDRDAYLGGVHATTQTEIEAQIAKMSEPFRQKLLKYNTLEEIFMLCRGSLFGFSTQSVSESLNNLLFSARTSVHLAGTHFVCMS
jgi:hypothetical protein